MSAKTIFEAMRSAGMTAEGACAMLGNMQAESGLHSNIAQRGMTKMSNQQYTEAADKYLINFTNDSIGYGLCQWTHPDRKSALLTFAQKRGASIGDEAIQVDFCIQELQEHYSKLWQQLTTGHDLFQLTQTVCLQYERPAHANVGTRYEYALSFAELASRPSTGSTEAPVTDACPIEKPSLSVFLLQHAMKEDGYWVGTTDGIKTEDFKAAFKEYAEDVLSC